MGRVLFCVSWRAQAEAAQARTAKANAGSGAAEPEDVAQPAPRDPGSVELPKVLIEQDTSTSWDGDGGSREGMHDRVGFSRIR